MTDIAIWILLTVATERLVELIVESKIFEPIRRWIKQWAYPMDAPPPDNVLQHLKVLLDYLFHCGYCVSVWVSAFFAYFSVKSVSEYWAVNYLVTLLALHGSSNLYHVIYELIRRGRVKTIDFNMRVIDQVEE